LERILISSKSNISVLKAAELTQNMYQIAYQLPHSKILNHQLLGMDEEQRELLRIIENSF